VSSSSRDALSESGYQWSASDNAVQGNTLELPAEVADIVADGKIVIKTVQYASTGFFPMAGLVNGIDFVVGSGGVVSIVVSSIADGTPLPAPLRLRFTDVSPLDTCVFWDFDLASWSTAGCILTFVDGNATCECSHMTNFAILTSVDGTLIGAQHTFNLSIITFVGCSLSIVALSLTIFTYLLFPVRCSVL
jgi:hypothetical protein